MKKLLIFLLLLGCEPAFALTIQYQDVDFRYTLGQIGMTVSGVATDVITSGSLNSFSMQCVWDTVTGTAPEFKLQSSNDETNWDDVSGADYTVVSSILTAGSHTWIIDPFPVNFSRVQMVTPSTTGNLNCIGVGARK